MREFSPHSFTPPWIRVHVRGSILVDHGVRVSNLEPQQQYE